MTSRRSAEKMRELGKMTILPGHGKPWVNFLPAMAEHSKERLQSTRLVEVRDVVGAHAALAERLRERAKVRAEHIEHLTLVVGRALGALGNEAFVGEVAHAGPRLFSAPEAVVAPRVVRNHAMRDSEAGAELTVARMLDKAAFTGLTVHETAVDRIGGKRGAVGFR